MNLEQFTPEEERNICENIIRLRKTYAYHKREFARIMGISVNTLNRIENYDLPKRLGLDHLQKLSEKFFIDVRKKGEWEEWEPTEFSMELFL